ncbi:MAG: sugar phosphate isomerase/epimerase family protein [Bryobacteraceae bacterium]
MKLGIGTYTYMWSIGLPGTAPENPMRAIDLIRKAHELGIRLVQFGPNLALYDLLQNELDEVLSACRAWNIELEVGTRGIEAERLKPLIAFTRDCGAKLLRTVPEIGGGVPSREELVPLFRAIEPILAEAEVRLALENSLIPAAELDAALQAIGSEWLGITLDTVNSLAIPEGTEEVARRLARWTCCLHIKDFAIRREWHMMGFRVEGRPAGKGQLNVPWLLQLLRSEGAQCNAILELWPPEQPGLQETIALERQWAAESVQYLRTLIEE